MKRKLIKDYSFEYHSKLISFIKGIIYKITPVEEDLTKVVVKGTYKFGEEEFEGKILLSESIARDIFEIKNFTLKIICEDCGSKIDDDIHHMVMIKDELWRDVSDGLKIRLLCDHCIESRLERKITWKDLKYNSITGFVIPCNLSYLVFNKRTSDLIDYVQNQNPKYPTRSTRDRSSNLAI